MFKKIMAVALLTSISSVALAGETVFLPATKDGYKADIGLAIVGGKIKEKGGSDNDKVSTKGVELSLNCPLLQPARHNIRQQISLMKTDEDGVKTSSLEISPHHMWQVNRRLSIGAGPSIGFTKVDVDAEGDDSAFTYGLGTSARFDITKKFFVSGEARYGWSDDLEIGGVEGDLENVRVTTKLGYQF